MSYDLFWKGPINAFDLYAEKAHIENMKADELAWIQGMYIADAIAQNLSMKKASIYPKEPYLVIRAKEKKRSEEDRNILLYKNLKNWSGGVKARLNKAPPE